MADHSALKACPFCGSEPLVATWDTGRHRVGCIAGECTTNPNATADSQELAIAAWNRRAASGEGISEEMVERARKAATWLVDRCSHPHDEEVFERHNAIIAALRSASRGESTEKPFEPDRTEDHRVIQEWAMRQPEKIKFFSAIANAEIARRMADKGNLEPHEPSWLIGASESIHWLLLTLREARLTAPQPPSLPTREQIEALVSGSINVGGQWVQFIRRDAVLALFPSTPAQKKETTE